MHEICFYTLLGGSATMTGKEITLEVMEKKPALLAAIEPRKNEEVSDLDNGEIPGDHLGMCIIRHYEKQMKENSHEYVLC